MKVTLTSRDVHQALQKYVQGSFGEHVVIVDTDFIVTRKPRGLSVVVDILSADDAAESMHVPEYASSNPEPKDVPDVSEEMEAPSNEPVSDQQFAEEALDTPTPNVEADVGETHPDSLFS